MDSLSLAVDFDGTLARSEYPNFPAAPLPYARERMQSYREAGFKVVIYSVRTNPIHIDAYEQARRMATWMLEQQIPFDAVSVDGKPAADAYIDDKGFAFTDWMDPNLSPGRLLDRYGRDKQGYAAGKARRRPDRRPDGAVWIGLAGKMGAGKSGVATVLQGLYGNAYVRGFAAGVKDKALSVCVDPSVKTPEVRAILQSIGQSERDRDPDYWITQYWRWATELPGFPNVNLLVDDVRYPNEVEFLGRKGFRVGYVYAPKPVRMVRLLRRDGAIPWDTTSHESETALDSFTDWDFTIHNYTTAEIDASLQILENLKD